MHKETIKNPEVKFSLRHWEDYSPKLSHFEVEHSDPLRTSDNLIIGNLIADGWEVHATRTTSFMGFPSGPSMLEKHFAAQERNEYQIQLGEEAGFLRFRFDSPERVYLTLFYIAHEKQGQGLARRHFKAVTDALFRAGAVFLLGFVSPSIYPARKPMDRTRLLRFYVEEAGFFASSEGWIGKFSPYADNSIRADAVRIEEPEKTGI